MYVCDCLRLSDVLAVILSFDGVGPGLLFSSLRVFGVSGALSDILDISASLCKYSTNYVRIFKLDAEIEVINVVIHPLAAMRNNLLITE